MKALIETTNSFMLMDPLTREVVGHSRPYVVEYTNFFESRTGKGELRVHASDLPDHATDAEFATCLKDADGNLELAIAAFLSIVNPEPESKPKGRSKAKLEE